MNHIFETLLAPYSKRYCLTRTLHVLSAIREDQDTTYIEKSVNLAAVMANDVDGQGDTINFSFCRLEP